MSGPERRPPDDELLDRYLDGNSEVSRAYRQASAPPPPADLDRRILEMARSELENAKPARAAANRGNRWRTPLAAAAVLVLSFGVLINLQRENTLTTAPPEAPVQRQPQALEKSERLPEQETAADAVEARPPPAASAAAAAPPPADAAASAPASAPIQAEPQMSQQKAQQKAERDAEQERRSEREATRKRFAADAPSTLIRSQAGAAADRARLAAPSEEPWSCQAPDAQWNRIRRLFAEQQPEQARERYRELETACRGIEVPEDLRERIENEGQSDTPE